MINRIGVLICFIVLLIAVSISAIAEAQNNPLTVRQAIIDRMKDPSDAYSITLIFDHHATQCQLIQNHKIEIIVLSGLDQTQARLGMIRKRVYYCTIYVPDITTELRWREAIKRYQPGSLESVPFRIQ